MRTFWALVFFALLLPAGSLAQEVSGYERTVGEQTVEEQQQTIEQLPAEEPAVKLLPDEEEQPGAEQPGAEQPEGKQPEGKHLLTSPEERTSGKKKITEEPAAEEQAGGDQAVEAQAAEGQRAEELAAVEPPSEEPLFQREVRFGHLALVPSFSTELVHDDNIYFGKGSNKTTELVEGDWIRHYRPALLLDWELNGRGSLKLGYDGDFARYSQNKFNDWRTNRGLLDLDYFTPGGLLVRIKNLFTDAQDPYGSINEFGLGRKTMRWMDEESTAAGFKISELFRVLALYNFFKQRYDSRLDFTQNYNKKEVGAGGELKIADKTWLFLRAHTGQQEYDTQRLGITRSNDASYGWKKVTTGLAWDSTSRFIGEVNVGYQWNSFDNKADIHGLPYKDKNTWIADTAFRFKQSEYRSFSLLFTRSIQQLGAGGSGYFTRTSLGAGLAQRIMQRVMLAAGGSYTKNTFFSDYRYYRGRDDKLLELNTALRYLLSDRFAVGIGYRRLRNSSTHEYEQYRVNQFSVSLEFNPVFLGRRPLELLTAQD